jgi:three-Cys-motif partner protein
VITTESFFERPRSWSLIKYKILDKYLAQYLPKVNQFYRSPAFIADLFAGKGKFDDGSPGSPIIIARHAYNYRQKLGFNNKVILSEIIEDDRNVLIENMKEYIGNKIVTVVPGEATDVGKYLISEIPASMPLFIFLDPFGIKGLSMNLLMQIFERAKEGSTEVLINFNYRAFQRLSGICRNLNSKNAILNKQAHKIKSIVDSSLNGDWWLSIMNSDKSSEYEKFKLIMSNYLSPFHQVFSWVGVLPVVDPKEKQDVKYYLIFASKSQVAIELMNDVTIKAQEEVTLEEIRERNLNTLFNSSNPEEFLHSVSERDIEELGENILAEITTKAVSIVGTYGNISSVQFTRSEIRGMMLKKEFARFTKSQYNEAVKKLISTGILSIDNDSAKNVDDRTIRISHKKN